MSACPSGTVFLVRIIRERCPYISGTLSASYRNVVPDWQESSIDYLSNAEIFHDYNQRCTVETTIDEVKSGFAFSENSQIDHKCNELYLLIKMIACNLQNWFRQTILPEEVRHHRITTLRRKIYRTCGMITGNGWYRHVVYQIDDGFQHIIEYIQAALACFRNSYETG